MIFLVLVMLAMPLGGVVALVWYFSSRSRPPQLVLPPQIPKNIPERLSEMEDLRARNLISEAEYEEKRNHLLREL